MGRQRGIEGLGGADNAGIAGGVGAEDDCITLAGELEGGFSRESRRAIVSENYNAYSKSQCESERGMDEAYLQSAESLGYTRPWMFVCLSGRRTSDPIAGVLRRWHRLTCSCYRPERMRTLCLVCIVTLSWVLVSRGGESRGGLRVRRTHLPLMHLERTVP